MLLACFHGADFIRLKLLYIYKLYLFYLPLDYFSYMQ